MTRGIKRKRDDVYYLDPVIFLVEDVLFKIPRHYLETHSSIFRDIFSLPQGDNDAEGSHDEKPFVLESVSKIDFRKLLMVIYPENPVVPITLDQDGWISVLKLSTLWELDTIREKAVKELQKLVDDAEKVVLGKTYRVGDWLVEGYFTLVNRDTTLSDADVDKLGSHTAIKLFRLREEVRGSKKAYKLGYKTYVKDRVHNTFETELLEAGCPPHNPTPLPRRHKDSDLLYPSSPNSSRKLEWVLDC